MAETSYTVICTNFYHRRAEVDGEAIEFAPDPETKTARAKVTRDQAEALAAGDAYTCPELESDGDEDDAPELGDLDGIGTATLEKLAAADVETMEALMGADPEALADATEIDQEKIEGWQAAASELTDEE